jgi:hypothetical protein
MTFPDPRPEMRRDFHLKEYESLKKEVADQIEHSRKLEIYVLGGLAAFYAWFSSARQVPNTVLWIPVVLSALGAFRSWAVGRRVGEIAFYLRRMEYAFAWNDSHLFGWETHRVSPGQRGVQPADEKKEPWFGPFTTTAAVFWGALVLGSLVAVRLFWKVHTSVDCGI